MSAATVNSERPMAHASCDGRRLRAYCIATATANAPDTKMVISGSTNASLAAADDERRGDDTQNYGSHERATRRLRAAGRPRGGGRDDRVARSCRGQPAETGAPQGGSRGSRDSQEQTCRGD